MSYANWIEVLGETTHGCTFVARRRKNARLREPATLAHVEIPLSQWRGHIGPWAEHLGKASKQVYPLDGGPPERSCGEVEVAKRLRRIRQHAYWVCSYAPAKVPEIWRPWSIAPNELPDWLRALDREIRASLSFKTGGIPDVVAWDTDDPLGTLLFVECKGPKEDVKETQEDWVGAALTYGLDETSFAVAVRPFV